MAEENNINKHSWQPFLRSSIRTGLLFGSLGLISWITGVPLLWPSLGPTAYVLAFDEDKNHPFTKVFGAHALGGIAGWLSHWIFAADISIGAINHPFAYGGLHIALSAIGALSLTTVFMRSTGWTHSPACATTLIIALGLIPGSSIQGILFILGAVVLIYGTHLLDEVLFRKTGWIK